MASGIAPICAGGQAPPLRPKKSDRTAGRRRSAPRGSGMKLDGLRLGADVTSRDDHKLGTVNGFVIDTGSQRLTHLVVDTGIFRSGEALWKGGWGMSHDRIVPFG